jgi:hypothetical protein
MAYGFYLCQHGKLSRYSLAAPFLNTVYKNAVAKLDTTSAPSHHPFPLNKMVAPPTGMFYGEHGLYSTGTGSGIAS